MKSHFWPKWLDSLPVFLSFAVAAVIVNTFSLRYSGTTLFLGVIAGGLTDLDHRTSGRLKHLSIIIPAFAFATLFTQFSYQHSLLLTLFMPILAFSTTMLGAIDAQYKTIAFGTLTVSIYSLITHSPDYAWYLNPLTIISGTLIYHIIGTIYQSLLPHRPVQASLSALFTALSQFINSKSALFSPDERHNIEQVQYQLSQDNATLILALNHSRERIFHRLSGQQAPLRTRRQLHDYFNAQDIHERISASISDYRQLNETLAHSDLLFRIERLLRLQAKACLRYAKALEEETTDDFSLPPEAVRAYIGLQQAWDKHRLSHGTTAATHSLNHIIDNLSKINDKISYLGHEENTLAPSIARTRPQTLKENWRTLKRHFTLQSSYFRHALRISLITLITGVMVAWFQPTPSGYWLMLTAILICQPNYVSTQKKLSQRTIGTLLGILIGTFLPLLAPDNITLLTLITLCNTLYFYFRDRNDPYSVTFITIQAFLGLALMGDNPQSLITIRIVDAFLGAGITWFAVTYLWPDWRYLSVKSTMMRALESNSQYLRTIMTQLGSTREDSPSYRQHRRRMHEQASELPELLRNMQAQANRYQRSLPLMHELIMHNYRLVGTLASLSLQRGSLTDLPQASIEHLHALGQDIATLIQTLPSLDKHALEDTLSRLHNALHYGLRETIEPSLNPDYHPLTPTIESLEQLLNQLSPLSDSLDELSMRA